MPLNFLVARLRRQFFFSGFFFPAPGWGRIQRCFFFATTGSDEQASRGDGGHGDDFCEVLLQHSLFFFQLILIPPHPAGPRDDLFTKLPFWQSKSFDSKFPQMRTSLASLASLDSFASHASMSKPATFCGSFTKKRSLCFWHNFCVFAQLRVKSAFALARAATQVRNPNK